MKFKAPPYGTIFGYSSWASAYVNLWTSRRQNPSSLLSKCLFHVFRSSDMFIFWNSEHKLSQLLGHCIAYTTKQGGSFWRFCLLKIVVFPHLLMFIVCVCVCVYIAATVTALSHISKITWSFSFLSVAISSFEIFIPDYLEEAKSCFYYFNFYFSALQ